MKVIRISLTLLLLLSFGKTFSQSVIVTMQGPGLLFGGCGVEVHLALTNLDPFNIELLAEDGSVQKHFTKNSLQYQLDTTKDKTHSTIDYSVNYTGGMINHRVVLSVHYLKNGADTVLWRHDYYVLQLPNPTVFIGDTITNGKMTRDEFLKMNNLGVALPYFPLYTVWFLTSYDVQYLPPDGNFKTYHVDKNIFTPELRSQMQAAKAGDTFIFKNVKVDGVDQYQRVVNTVKVEIE